MSALISRKVLMRKLFFAEDGRKYPTRDIDNFPVTVNLEDLRKIIRNEPTAYDVDKVVEQFKDEIRVIKNNICVEQSETIQAKLVHRLQQTEKLLSIVKGAAKDE